MDLGDGYSVRHISHYTVARQWPEKPAKGLVCCFTDGPVETRPAVWAVGLAFLDTEGPWMLVEWLRSNPSLPLAVRHEALTRLVPMMEAVCLAHGKQLLICSSSKGVEMGLARMGVAVANGCIVLAGTEVP